MYSEKFVMKPIGVVHSEHKILDQIPVQPIYADGCLGQVEIFPEYSAGLKDIEEFSHIYLLSLLHKGDATKLIIKPYLQDKERGLFSTRFPNRPNPIGLSIVRLVKRKDNILYVNGLDILDGTPLLDIKPYTARFDRIDNTKNGWQDDVKETLAQERGLRNYNGKK